MKTMKIFFLFFYILEYLNLPDRPADQPASDEDSGHDNVESIGIFLFFFQLNEGLEVNWTAQKGSPVSHRVDFNE